VIRCASGVTWDAVCPIYMLFHVTNARSQVQLSVDPANQEMISLCQAHQLKHTVETQDEASSRCDESNVYNTVHPDQPLGSFPMAGNFVSLYLPLGHIKSTQPDDKEFVLLARLSEKWLNTLF
jgi:hypothetical protein